MQFLPEPWKVWPTMLAFSVVSHGHGAQVLQLLAQLTQLQRGLACRIWVTFNVEEPDLARALIQSDATWQGLLDVRTICNVHPQGFGANHNQAFAREAQQADRAPLFVVINPDISWNHDPWPAMLQTVALPGVGCVYPRQVDAQGCPQDHARGLPTPWSLVRRYLGHARRESVPSPDWANAALLLFHSTVYEQLNGFDESYHMYCEDVDICLRLQMAGYRLTEASGACVVHDARRASHRNVRHLNWHLRSLLRLWSSPAYRYYLQRLENAHG